MIYRLASVSFSVAVSFCVLSGCEPTYTQVTIKENGLQQVDIKHRYQDVLPQSEMKRFELLSAKALPGDFAIRFAERTDITMYLDETLDAKMWCGVVDIEGVGERNFGYVVARNRTEKNSIAMFAADRDSCMKSLWENTRHPEFSSKE